MEIVMRHRIMWSGFGAILCTLALWTAAPAVFSMLALGGASTASAAPKEDELEEKPAVGGADEKAGADETKAVKDEEKGKKEKSFLAWLYTSLTPRYVVIFLIITFNAVAFVVMIVLGLRRSVLCPDDLVVAFQTKLDAKQYQEAYELVKADGSFLGKVLAAGMTRLSEGYDASLEAMQEVGEEQNMKLEQRNGYVALIAQIGPMFGLLGTVDGMVQAFDVIAHTNVTPKPSDLAQGIGTALVTTVVGLWIAIPMIAFYHVVRNRLARMMLEISTLGVNLMKRFNTIQVTIKKM
jgi:biopolymer transport protein ExbB